MPEECNAEEIPKSNPAACNEVADICLNIGEFQEGRDASKCLSGGYPCCIPICLQQRNETRNSCCFIDFLRKTGKGSGYNP